MLAELRQKLSALRSGEDRGVSPVYGVILMVAITVILAAVIGAFVLGLGDGLGSNPQATVSVSGGDVIVQSSDADGVAVVNSSSDLPLTSEPTNNATAVGQSMTVGAGDDMVVAYNVDGSDYEYSVVRNLD